MGKKKSKKKKNPGRAMREHDKETKRHSINPRITSIDDCLLSTGEANIFKTPSGIIYRQPDNLYFCEGHKLIVDEYKNTTRQEYKAMKQISDYKETLTRIFPNWEVITRYVHDVNNVKVIDNYKLTGR